MKKLVFLFCLIISGVPALAQNDKPSCSDEGGKSPVINVTIDKRRVKPNERANVKVTLTDCGGKPLDNRKVSTRIISGEQKPNDLGKDFTTDKSGAFTDSVSQNKNSVLSYVAMFEYADADGDKQIALDSEPLIVGDIFDDIGDKGTGMKMWLMNVNYEYQSSDRMEKEDEILGMQTASGRTTSSGSLMILLKAQIFEDGEIIPIDQELNRVNGFVTYFESGKNNYKDCGSHSSVYTATLDTSPEGKKFSNGSFHYYPEENLFTAAVGSLQVKGIDKQVRGCPSKNASEEKTLNIPPYLIGGIECDLDLKDGAPQDGMFKCHFHRYTDLTGTKEKNQYSNVATEYSGFAYIKGDVEVQPLTPVVSGKNKK